MRQNGSFLVLGSKQDLFAQEVCRRYDTAVWCNEDELVQARPVLFQTSRKIAAGFLVIGGTAIALHQLRGVLVRLRDWGPSKSLGLQEQVEVYQETTASWYAALAALSCPVINRFGLSWWVRDASYPLELRGELAAALGIPEQETGETEKGSVYVCGSVIRRASDDAARFEQYLHENSESLQQWQANTGVHLCRIDFSAGESLKVDYVEPFPLFDNEPSALLEEVAAGAAEALPGMP
jgi:hypothetical protein